MLILVFITDWKGKTELCTHGLKWQKRNFVPHGLGWQKRKVVPHLRRQRSLAWVCLRNHRWRRRSCIWRVAVSPCQRWRKLCRRPVLYSRFPEELSLVEWRGAWHTEYNNGLIWGIVIVCSSSLYWVRRIWRRKRWYGTYLRYMGGMCGILVVQITQQFYCFK